MSRRWLVPAAWAFALAPATAWAEASFVIQARGQGFADSTPVAPQPGNAATTLGAQRIAAVARAADLWGERLDSAVPVELDVVFQSLGCDDDGAVLAAAGAVSLFSGLGDAGADPALWYPSALANRFAGRDLAPNEPDIQVMINLSIDEECRGGFGGFYYGLDAQPGGQVDLVEVILHELAHGLGFSSWIDLETGATYGDGLDVFSAQILDLAENKTWRELSVEERRASALKVRGLAFKGKQTSAAAAELLDKGSPSLTLQPRPPGFVGAVSDTGESYPDLEGPVYFDDSSAGCPATSDALGGALVLIGPDCFASSTEPRLIAAGAAGALVALPWSYDQPALPFSPLDGMLSLPSLTISPDDANAVRAALQTGPLNARMHWDAQRLVGADAAGRVLLFASQPLDSGSSVSHFEPLARPDLLMEPFISPTPRHDLDLSLPLLVDLGWEPFCGNDRLDAGEQCDDGESNRDERPDACRASCERPRCGDAVVDGSEECDEGSLNGTRETCRSNCTRPRCGDDIVDPGEECDEGTLNGTGDTCTSTCTRPTPRPEPRCGDGNIDPGEACDDGAGNDDRRADACRSDCSRARCGDGVLDEGETCDSTLLCSESCRLVNIPGQRLPWSDPWDKPGEDEEDEKEPEPADESGGCSVWHGRGRTLPTAALLSLVLGLLTRRRASGASRSSQRARKPS